MTKIKNIIARQIIDSRGNPTVEVDVPQNDHVAFDDLAEEILDGN